MVEHTATYGEMRVSIVGSNAAVGRAVAEDVSATLREAVAAHGAAAIILATGNSQLSFLSVLAAAHDLDWGAIDIFHMDEYLGLPASHPASFRRYMREKLVDLVHPRAFHGIEGDAPDPTAEMARYAALLREHRPIACVLGIGENGHLAFNDPPADFQAAQDLAIVKLDEISRRQQVGEGHFPDIAAVPERAITLTIPALLAPRHVIAVVPETRKARIVKAALEGPITPLCPASVLRTVSHARMYLDRDSAALLEPRQ